MTSLRDHLQDIYSQRGDLTPALVVEAATPDSHPLHSHFEWNNEIAGPLYREHQAADLIRSVKVRHTTRTGEKVDIRAFVVVPQEVREAQTYMPVEALYEDPKMAAVVLAQAKREWQTLLAKYQHLEDFLTLVRSDIGDAA